jgi:hypothetical protein
VKSIKSPKINISEFLEKATYIFLSLATVSYLKSISEAIDDIKQVDLRIIEFSNILINYGWAPTRQIDYDTMDKIVGIYNDDLRNEKEKEKLINKAILDYYNENRLNELLMSWGRKPLLLKRIEILEDAVKAHISRKYNLVVPVMIAQLEGIVANGFYHKGEIHEPRYKCYLDEIISMESNIIYDNVATDFFIKVLMVNFQHGSQLNSSSSRHAILHGADIRYGSPENSLKNILFFDYIQDKFNLFSYKNSKIVHKIGCNKVKAIERNEERTINTAKLNNYFIVNKNGTSHYFKKNMSFYVDANTALERITALQGVP